MTNKWNIDYWKDSKKLYNELDWKSNRSRKLSYTLTITSKID